MDQNVRRELTELNRRVSSAEETARAAETALRKAREGSIVRDNLREAIPDRMRRTIELHAIRGAKDPVLEAAKDAWFKSVILGNAPQIDAGVSPGQMFRDADRLAEAMGEITKATINENTATQGGNLVPTIVEARVLALLADSNPVRRMGVPWTMTSKTATVPSPGAITSYVVSELGTAVTAGEPQVDAVTLTAKTFVAYGLATVEAVQDSSIGIADLFATLAADEFGRQEIRLGLEGTAGDPISGLVVASGLNTLDATTATNTSAVPTYAQCVKLVFTGSKRATRRKGAYFFHPLALANIVGQVGTNLAVIPQSPESVDPEADAVIARYPAYGCDQIKGDRTDVGGTDVSYGYFGNFADYFVIGDRLGLTVLASPFVKWAEGLVGFRALKRTAITIAKGAAFTQIKKVKSTLA